MWSWRNYSIGTLGDEVLYVLCTVLCTYVLYAHVCEAKLHHISTKCEHTWVYKGTRYFMCTYLYLYLVRIHRIYMYRHGATWYRVLVDVVPRTCSYKYYVHMYICTYVLVPWSDMTVLGKNEVEKSTS